MPASINFVSKEVPFSDKFVSWALTVGRLLVVLTELVALSAFIYRFSLDRQLIDLHSHIKDKQAIVNTLRKSEDNYRNLQDRIALVKTFSTLSNNTSLLLTDISAFTPKEIEFNNFSIYKDHISISANSSSKQSLTAFIDSLKSYGKIQSVSIDNIENKTTSGIIVVNITAHLK